jgi:hypothetical protein
MGFFIRDLHHHIEQLHNKQILEYQSDQSFTLYRGQGIRLTTFYLPLKIVKFLSPMLKATRAIPIVSEFCLS